MFDSHFIPFVTPLTTEKSAMPVTIPMMRTRTMLLGVEMMSRNSSPPAICVTPRPSDVAMPKTVPTTAMTSMTSPSQPLARSRSTGSTVQRMEIGRLRTWTA